MQTTTDTTDTNVTEKTVFYMSTKLFATPPPGECYSLLSDLKVRQGEKFRNFLRMEFV